jgi:hypothetical protein
VSCCPLSDPDSQFHSLSSKIQASLAVYQIYLFALPQTYSLPRHLWESGLGFPISPKNLSILKTCTSFHSHRSSNTRNQSLCHSNWRWLTKSVTGSKCEIFGPSSRANM